MQNGYEAKIKCRECNMKMIEISDEVEVRAWLKRIKEAEQAGAHRLIGGFIKFSENLVRVTYHSLAEVEVWGSKFPLGKKCWFRLCPYCQEKALEKIRKKRRNKKL